MAIGGIGHQGHKFQFFKKIIIFLLFLLKFYYDNLAWRITTIVTSGGLAVDRANTLAAAL
jgi:hypothetical protein